MAIGAIGVDPAVRWPSRRRITMPSARRIGDTRQQLRGRAVRGRGGRAVGQRGGAASAGRSRSRRSRHSARRWTTWFRRWRCRTGCSWSRCLPATECLGRRWEYTGPKRRRPDPVSGMGHKYVRVVSCTTQALLVGLGAYEGEPWPARLETVSGSRPCRPWTLPTSAQRTLLLRASRRNCPPTRGTWRQWTLQSTSLNQQAGIV
jgi:hypothetical protein